MPGVHAVLTHDDVPGEKLYGLEFRDQPVLAIDRVRYFGEPVALVAAEHPEQARRAAEKIRVEYEPLEPVVDMERATEQEPTPSRPADRGPRLPATTRGRTSSARSSIRHGDPDAAGRGRGRGRLRGRHPGPGLPRSGVGARRPGRRGRHRHLRRHAVAPRRPRPDRALPRAPAEQVRIHLAGVGGAFGGREDLSMQIHAALLALHTNRPVKIVYNREESFTGHVHRHPARIWAEHRATRDGRLVSVRMRSSSTAAPTPRARRRSIANAAAFACGPYDVANALIEATVVYTNNPPCGAMRGFGAVQTCFAGEAQMDKLAAALGHRPGRAAAAERARARRRAPDGPADRRARSPSPR